MSARNWQSLRQRADFLRLQNTGQKWITPAFIVYASPSTHPPHVGFTVTKKLGGAVIRNRIRRRLREATSQANLPDWEIVFIARQDAETHAMPDLVRDMNWAFGKLASRINGDTNESPQ